MRSHFLIVGLSKPKSITCKTDKENAFWPKVNLTNERFDAFWDYCGGSLFSDEPKYAEIEHDGLDKTGEPINPVLIGIDTTPPEKQTNKR